MKVYKWRLKFEDYEYEIVYKPGKINKNADALSRNPIPQFKYLLSPSLEKQTLATFTCR